MHHDKVPVVYIGKSTNTKYACARETGFPTFKFQFHVKLGKRVVLLNLPKITCYTCTVLVKPANNQYQKIKDNSRLVVTIHSF